MTSGNRITTYERGTARELAARESLIVRRQLAGIQFG